MSACELRPRVYLRPTHIIPTIFITVAVDYATIASSPAVVTVSSCVLATSFACRYTWVDMFVGADMFDMSRGQ